MNKTPSEKYLIKAALLSRDEAELFYSRMGRKLSRRLDDHGVIPVEALAIQLEKEDEDLQEWRERFAELKVEHSKNEF
jgi:hypothetical protein